MTPLRQHMIAALQRSGKRERTQQSSVREVRLLAQCSGTSPHRISEYELQPYVLHRKNVDGLAPNSRRLCTSGIRCFCHQVLERDRTTLDRMRAESEHRLPAVLSGQEVRRLLSMTTPWPNRGACTTVYRLGLRLHEGRSWHVSDIDGQRPMVHGHRGKGAKDRDVPLPQDPLALLRHDGTTHRHPPGLFPTAGRDQKPRPTAPPTHASTPRPRRLPQSHTTRRHHHT